jgi:hypothetical protein
MEPHKNPVTLLGTPVMLLVGLMKPSGNSGW